MRNRVNDKDRTKQIPRLLAPVCQQTTAAPHQYTQHGLLTALNPGPSFFGSGQANSIYKGLDSKYLGLCRPQGVCNPPTLPLQGESSRPAHVHEWMWLWAQQPYLQTRWEQDAVCRSHSIRLETTTQTLLTRNRGKIHLLSSTGQFHWISLHNVSYLPFPLPQPHTSFTPPATYAHVPAFAHAVPSPWIPFLPLTTYAYLLSVKSSSTDCKQILRTYC